MMLSTRNFVEAGSTSPDTRLITISTKPIANNPRRGRISCQISGSPLKTCVFFAGFFCSSVIDVRLLGFLDLAIRCETRELISSLRAGSRFIQSQKHAIERRFALPPMQVCESSDAKREKVARTEACAPVAQTKRPPGNRAAFSSRENSSNGG